MAGAFKASAPVLISLTSAGQELEVYLDGALVPTSSRFDFSANDLAGQLILGTSPRVGSGWTGDVLGLAVYRRHITAAEARAHYIQWSGEGQYTGPGDDPLALYLFDEQRGQVVQNRTGLGSNLYIPNQYFVVDQRLLQSPSQEFRLSWGYWKDVAVNILGFLPLGFFFFAYLRKIHPRTAGLMTLVVGASTSLMIELLQSYLPTRNSGITDLITNTLGTYLGIILFHRAISSSIPSSVAAFFGHGQRTSSTGWSGAGV